MAEGICMLGTLFLIALQDMKRKDISISMLLVLGILAVVFHMIYEKRSIYDMLLGAAIGCVLMALSLISGGKIGMGDGVLITMTGLWWGFWDNLMMLFLSTALMGATGIILIIAGKKNKDDEIPYAPYLFFTAVAALFCRRYMDWS